MISGARRACLPAALAALALAPLRGAYGDQFHYKDLLIGERATGMGGAYVAVSNDPSGIFHNPAGLVFSMENYLNLSATAFTTSNEKFADVFQGQGYTLSSSNLVPVFFGFTQSFGAHKLGFAVVVPNADLIDQDDTISNGSTEADKPNTLRRRFFHQDQTYLVGPAYARKLSDDLTIGVTMFGFIRLDDFMDHQTVLFNPVGTGKYLVQDSFQKRSEYGVVPKLGLMYRATPRLTLGLTVSQIRNLGGSGTYQLERTKVGVTGAPVMPTGTYNTDQDFTRLDNVFSELANPVQLATGLSYNFSERLLATAQLDLNGPDTNFPEYPVVTTYNWALGGEYTLNERWAFRSGLYSNNSRVAKVSPLGTNQPSHVDLLGVTAGLSFYKTNSSLGVSGAYSGGVGEGQAIADTTTIQRVTQRAFAVYITGSYQL